MHSTTSISSESAPAEKKAGLLYWSQRVIEECDKAAHDFAPDPVHDLRVAIRRCRSMADGFLSVDPDPEWKQMKRLGKALFSSLGELRDVQVMEEWVAKLSEPEDPVRAILLNELQRRESDLKVTAQHALADFDRKHWLALNARLAERAEKVPVDGVVFQLLALERWTEARELHHCALRNRSSVAYHRLRIGIKRLRYTVENFLPSLHEQWAKDLRNLQDALGEVHDFDVLWALLQSHREISGEVRLRWRETITMERNKRLALYRSRMVGRHTLWYTWRKALPAGKELEHAALEKLRLWASFLDPNFDHATQVADLALRIYDSMGEQGIVRTRPANRRVLQAAALMHEVGRSREGKKHQRRSYRMLRNLAPPPGWSAQDMRAVAIVARYHRGAIAPATHRMFAGMPSRVRSELLMLAGVLRLANALTLAAAPAHVAPVIQRQDGALVVTAHHVDGGVGPAGERLARAKYLLEAACGLPIKIVGAHLAPTNPTTEQQRRKRGKFPPVKPAP